MSRVGLSEAEFGILTPSSIPSNREPGPTIPFVNVAPFKSAPGFVPCTSSAVLSPDHQLTRPDGGGGRAAGVFTGSVLPEIFIEDSSSLAPFLHIPFRQCLNPRRRLPAPPPKSDFRDQVSAVDRIPDYFFLTIVPSKPGSNVSFTVESEACRNSTRAPHRSHFSVTTYWQSDQTYQKIF